MNKLEKNALEIELRRLITDQSEGEWDDDLIEKDVKKFLDRLIPLIDSFNKPQA